MSLNLSRTFGPAGVLASSPWNRAAKHLSFRTQRYARNGLLLPFEQMATFSRPLSPAERINIAGDGLLAQTPPNVPRIDSRGYLPEVAAANSARNGALAGAVANVSFPDHFNAFNSGGLTATCVDVTPQRGGPASGGWNDVAIRFQGLTNSTAAVFSFETVSGIAASSGQTWTASLFAGITGGSLANVSSVRTSVRFVNANSFDANMSLSAAIVRQPAATAVAGAGATHVVPAVAMFFASGVNVDVTITFRLIQCEQTAGALSPIITNGSAITRAADVLNVPINDIGAGADWTLCGVARMPSASGSASKQLVNLAVDSSNVFRIQAQPGLINAFTVVGGSGQSGNVAVSAPVAGSLIGWCLVREGPNLRLSLNGGAPVSAAPAAMPNSPISILNVGHSFSTSQFDAEIAEVLQFYGAANDATMQTYSTPSTWGVI